MADEVAKSAVAEPEKEDGKVEGTEEKVEATQATTTGVDPIEVKRGLKIARCQVLSPLNPSYRLRLRQRLNSRASMVCERSLQLLLRRNLPW